MQPDKKAKAREYSLRRLYGITPEQYEELLVKQEGKCAICDRHESEFPTRLAVDHDHVTREIRGLLCNFCNRRIVGRHRDPSVLRRVADYLENNTGWFVPEKKRRRRTPRKRKKHGGKDTGSKDTNT